MKIKIENKDKRGSVYCGLINNNEKFLIAEIKKNTARGGHYHNVDTYHFVVSGNIIYYEKLLDKYGNKIKSKKQIKQTIKEGQKIFTPAFSAHLIVANTNSVIIEPISKNKKTINYHPYRKRVVK